MEIGHCGRRSPSRKIVEEQVSSELLENKVQEKSLSCLEKIAECFAFCCIPSQEHYSPLQFPACGPSMMMFPMER